MQPEICIVGKLILYQKDNMVPRFYTDTYNQVHVCNMKAEKKLFKGTGGTKGRKKRSNKNMCVDASHTGGSVYIYLSQMVPGPILGAITWKSQKAQWSYKSLHLG